MKEQSQKTKIILIGYRATGKSTIASLIAERWGFDWNDADVAVEERAGKRISAIFRDEGEPYFRDLEASTLADILTAPGPLVVATGGGAPMREETRRVMRDRGVVVWLTASVETIARRMSGDATTSSRRPALTKAGSPIAEIERVLSVREPIYREASDFAVDTNDKTVDEIVEEIMDQAPSFFFKGRRCADA